jgi:Protein of unknown function (DUF1688)
MSDIDSIRSTQTIRDRCHQLYQIGLKGGLPHFRIKKEKISAVANFVMQVTKENYPDGNIPYHSRWGHFQVGGQDRISWLRTHCDPTRRDELSKCRMFYDLVVPSILLDAGAGMKWNYTDSQGKIYSKSEGLAVASFDMFADGLFSSNPKIALQSDEVALQRMQSDVLANGFQSSTKNPLVALDGRLLLLKNLGKALTNSRFFGGPAAGTVGALVDYLLTTYGAQTIRATDVLATVLEAFGSIWPGRIQIENTNLGDVWPHSLIGGTGPTKNLVPFHKLSQWMTYSLLEPLEWTGIKITNVEDMTGLPEYRNGGLLIDMGVLETVNPEALEKEYSPGDEFVVEWRALTVAILDEIGNEVRKSLGKTMAELPLAKVLQGGTWAAGRKVASKLRTDGGSPVKLKSDGTVF